MSRPLLKIHAVAEAEIAEARNWYATKSAEAAKRFLAEVDRAFNHIVSGPLIAPKYLYRTRGYLLRDYPYVVVYDRIECEDSRPGKH